MAFMLLIGQSVWAVSVVGCGGSGAELGCAELPACGGNPTGSWILGSGSSFCQYLPPLSYAVPALAPPQNMLTQTPTAQPAPKSPGSACSDLAYWPNFDTTTNSNIKNVSLPHLRGRINSNSSVQLNSDGSYSVALQSVSTTTTHFAPSCLTAYGANPTCDDLSAALTAYQTMPNFYVVPKPFACVTASDGGCDCTYPYESTAADEGTWRNSGNILYFFSSQNATQPIVETTFCVNPGKSLSISGRDGESLFTVNGLRSFTMNADTSGLTSGDAGP